MLALHVVNEIKRLLDKGEMSQRKIAKEVGVARATVQAIASGRRGLHGREQASPQESEGLPMAPPERCAGCGMLVILPCVYCRAQAYATRQRAEQPPASARAA